MNNLKYKELIKDNLRLFLNYVVLQYHVFVFKG